MQDAYDKTLLNTSLFSYNKQVLIREKKLYVSALRNVWKTNAYWFSDVRVRSDGFAYFVK